MEIRHSTAIGTCDWILQSPEYTKFLSDDSSHLLWISGDPGVGKSHLTARIIKELEDQLIVGKEGAFSPSCASFFCEFEMSRSPVDAVHVINKDANAAEDDLDPYESNSNSDFGYDGVSSNSGGSGSDRSDEDPILRLPIAELLKTLAWELTEKERAYEIQLIRTMNTSTIRQLWDGLFDNGYFAKRPCFLVIDGLDTITEEERLILYDCIKGLSRQNEAAFVNLKIILLGRSDVTEKLAASFGGSLASIAVAERENEADIRQFASDSLKEVPKYKRVLKNAQLADQYLNGLLAASRGNFERRLMSVDAEVLEKVLT